MVTISKKHLHLINENNLCVILNYLDPDEYLSLLKLSFLASKNVLSNIFLLLQAELRRLNKKLSPAQAEEYVNLAKRYIDDIKTNMEFHNMMLLISEYISEHDKNYFLQKFKDHHLHGMNDYYILFKSFKNILMPDEFTQLLSTAKHTILNDSDSEYNKVKCVINIAGLMDDNDRYSFIASFSHLFADSDHIINSAKLLSKHDEKVHLIKECLKNVNEAIMLSEIYCYLNSLKSECDTVESNEILSDICLKLQNIRYESFVSLFEELQLIDKSLRLKIIINNIDLISDTNVKFLYLYLSRDDKVILNDLHELMDRLTSLQQFSKRPTHVIYPDRVKFSDKIHYYALNTKWLMPLIDSLIKSAVENYHVDLLIRLSKLPFFNERVLDMKLDEQKIQRLLSIDKASVQYFETIKRQFAANANNIDFEGLLLACAQINARKEYDFSPTVLETEIQFINYLSSLKDMPRPLRERFIIESAHRACGDIWIDEKGQVSVLYVDSMGFESIYNSSYQIALADQFPAADIYISNIKLQKDYISCAIFALDALVNLHTIENYLPERFKQHPAPLYAYCKESAKALDKSKIHLSVKFQACNLPIRMMLNMQSRKIEQIIGANQEEAQLEVNKIHEMPMAAVKRHFVNDKDDIDINNRVNNKLASIHKRNIEYMLKTPAFNEGMKYFSFMNFASFSNLLDTLKNLNNPKQCYLLAKKNRHLFKDINLNQLESYLDAGDYAKLKAIFTADTRKATVAPSEAHFKSQII